MDRSILEPSPSKNVKATLHGFYLSHGKWRSNKLMQTAGFGSFELYKRVDSFHMQWLLGSVLQMLPQRFPGLQNPPVAKKRAQEAAHFLKAVDSSSVKTPAPSVTPVGRGAEGVLDQDFLS